MYARAAFRCWRVAEKATRKEAMRRLALTSLLLVLVASAFIAPSAAQGGNPIQLGTVRVNVATPLFFLGPGPGCLFRAFYGLSSPDGQTVGQGQNCIRSDDGQGTLLIDVTLSLPGGTIQASITDVETSDFDPATGVLTITEDWNGPVTGGKGLYNGATGTLSAHGSVIVNPDGSGSFDIPIVVTLI
jgi:hypothetical protein